MREGEGSVWETVHEIEKAGLSKCSGLTVKKAAEVTAVEETWQDEVVFCSSSCDQGGKPVCLLCLALVNGSPRTDTAEKI